jgi:hypothetical protein
MNVQGDILASSESIIVNESKNKHLKREQPERSQSKAARAARDYNKRNDQRSEDIKENKATF